MDREGERVTCLESYMNSLIPHNPSWMSSDGSPNLAICIKMSSESGRHLVTARDIAQGEVLMCEPPAVVATKTGCKPTCLNCMIGLPNNYPSCDGCGVPLCVPKCEGKGHTDSECEILKRLGLKDLRERLSKESETDNENSETTSELSYSENDCSDTETTSDSENSSDESIKILTVLNTIMLPLRILQTLKEAPMLSKVIFSLQSHTQTLFKLPIGKFHLKDMFGALQDYLNIKVPPKFAERLCGIIITNTFNIITETNKVGRALAPLSAILNHSCMANAERFFSNDMMIIRASVPIAKGTPVTISYTHNILGNRIRQAYLHTTKFFKCTCPRCLDPTEMGSHASSLKCNCGHGYLIPPKEWSSEWNCNECMKSSTSKNADLLIKMVGSFIAGPRKTISSKRLALNQASDILGAQHYISMEFKLVLAESLLMQSITDVTESDIQEALDLIDELHTFSSQIEPGFTRFKGVLLLRQLQAWHLQLNLEKDKKDKLESNKQSEQNNNVEASSDNNVTKEFKNTMGIVEECKEILKYDRLFTDVLEVTHKLCEQQNKGQLITK